MTSPPPDDLRTPAPTEPEVVWWSDAIALTLRRLGFRRLALNPGASFRGLHDSLVNELGDEDPELVLCLHEEHAVAVAHGYAKVTGEPMAVALHTNVGLMHATMAIFNAFCDRVPMVIVGATGPFAADRRRPWIEWIHTSADQGALIRPFVKWDDSPASGPASLEALARADAVTRAAPSAPVYVCFDAGVLESEASPEVSLPDLERRRAPAPGAPPPAAVDCAAELLGTAERPLLLVGRVDGGEAGWRARVELAERLGAAVLTDLKVAAGFPADHPAVAAVPGTFLTPSGRELLASADAILALDWVDLAGSLRQALGDAEPEARIVAASLDAALHNGWSKDHFALPPVDLPIAADPDLLVTALLERIGEEAPRRAGWPPPIDPPATAGPTAGAIGMRGLAAALEGALADGPVCTVRLPLGWDGADLRATAPLDYLGQDGGAGLGSGPGMAVGAALGLADADPDRLAVAVLGDGDFLMGAQALWTAARHRLSLLVVVADNRSFFNDEVHQERMAVARGRAVENRSVGIAIDDPDPDLAALARSLGLVGHGPVTAPGELAAVLSGAAREARGGGAVVVDVRIDTAGYPGTPVPRSAG
ncbi:MAG TPA: thiamine pyrophosphate-binding protein [Solirubrobacterales bacterium]|nr:thiamine pyrophosphate-binding protein [Solirubrobacterales bacterium]